MFVCLCNGFTERQVRQCLDAGAKSVAAVYRCLGQPQCGKCICHVRDMVNAARDSAAHCNAIAAAPVASDERAPLGAVPALA